MKDVIFERNALPTAIEQEVRSASTLEQIVSLFKRLFPANMLPGHKGDGSDYGLKVRGIKTREKLNAQCKEIISRVHKPEDLTEEERNILLQYSGRGGTSDNSQFEYYTPTHVAQGVWDAMKANGFENGNVLEPSCGAGVFAGTKPSGVVVSGNDIDPVASKVAALLNPSDHISTSSFEEVVMETPDDTFDSCIGNVPFGTARGKSIHIDPAYKNEKSIERYFILRALDKIRPGGLACLVCPTNIVGNKGAKWEAFRRAVSRKAEFLGAHKLPSKTFSAQGTDTVVDVVVFRKHNKELLERLREDEISTDTLEQAKVYWSEFIEGKYWQGAGRPFIMGKYTPKVPGDRWSREVVDGDVDNEGLKLKLAQKFHSRIDYDLLNTAETITRNYAEGDSRYINGDPYRLTNGEWVKQAMAEEVKDEKIDVQEAYGADSLEELSSLLSDNIGALEISFAQAQRVLSAHPEFMTQQMKDAVQAAEEQIDEALREQVYRGSIIGSMIAKMGIDEEGGEDVSTRRLTLQNLVTKEVERYGLPLNSKISLSGQQSRAFGVFMNAVDRKGTFSDLLSGNLDKTKAKGYREDSIADITHHLLQHEDYPQVELEDVKKLYVGDLKIETLGDIAELEDIAITPEGTIEPFNSYCTGNVASKIAELVDAMASETDTRIQAKFQKQIDAMTAKIKMTSVEDITFGLQNKWFSPKYIVEFLRQNGFPRASYMTEKVVEVEQYDGTTELEKQLVEDFEAKDGQFYLDSDKPEQKEYLKQLQAYLNGKKVTSSKQELIAQYKENVQETERLFDSFMKMHIDSDRLAHEYSLKYNGFIKPEYSEDKLDIDEYLSGEIIPHTYQNAEVRRLSEMGCGICGFGTGLGKSFTALAMAAYNHKHGRAKRTCVIVPNSVLENWYHEARMLYTEEYMRNNVHFIGLEPKKDKDGAYVRKPILDENGKPRTKKDGAPMMQDEVVFTNSKQEIFESMWQVPQSNFSLVVMTKEKFKSIPIRKETLDAYTKDMVDRHLMSEKEQAALNDKGGKGGKSYAEDVHATKLEERFSDEGTQKKGELPFLEDMGFDSIITDESHFFKNSLEGGEHTKGIVYVPDPGKPAQIASDMAIKSHYIRTKMGGRGVYGLTATPVTNSPISG